MTSKLNGFFGVGLEGLQVHQIFLSPIHLVCPECIHKVGEDGDIEEVETILDLIEKIKDAIEEKE